MGESGEDRKIHRAFVLGAGASLHAGYPLIRNLCPTLMEWAEANRPPNSLYWPEREELAKFGSLDDIEELVTKIEQAEKPGGQLPRLLEALCRFFDSIRVSEASLYQRLAAGIVRAGDVIVSFNYDVSLDRELRRAQKWQIGDGYGFDLGINGLPTSPVKLLKLHGSTNWLDSLFGGAPGGSFLVSQSGSGVYGSRPVVRAEEFNFLDYTGITDPAYNGGGVNREGSMIPPGRNKQFCVKTSTGREREAFWSSLWGQAVESLERAEEIIIIGYSCPTADTEAQKLLFEQSNKNCSLTICCGSRTSSLGDEFVRCGFERHRVRTDCTRFEDFVAACDRELVS